MSTPLWVIGLVLLCAFIGAGAQLLLKMASSEVSFSPASWLNIKLFVAGFLFVLSAVLFTIALRNGNLAVLYAVFATSYIWVALASAFVLHEHILLHNWIGFALLVAGITLIAL